MRTTWNLWFYECIAYLSYGMNSRGKIWTWQVAWCLCCCQWCYSVFLWQLKRNTNPLLSYPFPSIWYPGLHCWRLKLIWSFFRMIYTRVQFSFLCKNTEYEEAGACHSCVFRASNRLLNFPWLLLSSVCPSKMMEEYVGDDLISKVLAMQTGRFGFDFP